MINSIGQTIKRLCKEIDMTQESLLNCSSSPNSSFSASSPLISLLEMIAMHKHGLFETHNDNTFFVRNCRIIGVILPSRYDF